MTKAKFVVLVIIGMVIGYGASWVKADADRASELIANMDAFQFESCKEHNEFNAQFDPETEQVDCEKEYLD